MILRADVHWTYRGMHIDLDLDQEAVEALDLVAQLQGLTRAAVIEKLVRDELEAPDQGKGSHAGT